MKTVLVRHLPPVIEPGICYGHLDIPMRPGGASELARSVAGQMSEGPVRVWTSPAIRCRPLARLIAESLSAPLSADPRLLELDFGDWEGKPWDDVPRAELDRWAADPAAFRAPGGESGTQLIQRVRAFHQELCREGQDCVVVSHGGPLKVLISLLRGEPVDLLATPPAMGAITSLTVP
jgi:alpha-ribazole phosphatase